MHLSLLQEGFLTIEDDLVTEDEVTKMFEGDELKQLKGKSDFYVYFHRPQLEAMINFFCKLI